MNGWVNSFSNIPLLFYLFSAILFKVFEIISSLNLCEIWEFNLNYLEFATSFGEFTKSENNFAYF